MKLANSPSVGGSRQVTTVVDALKLLGLSVVRQLALGLSIVSNHFTGNCKGFDYKGFWSRSLATGCALQLLSGRQRLLTPEEGFTCGLLSRIGYLGFASVFPEVYSDLQLTVAKDPSVDLTELERTDFGIDHNQLAAELLAEWALPRLMINAVLHYERIEEDGAPLNSRELALARQLNFAAYWATLCVSSESVRGSMLPKFFELGKALGLDRDTLIEMDGQLIADWRVWGESLSVLVQTPVPMEMLESLLSSPPVSVSTDSALGILVADRDAVLRSQLEALLSAIGSVETASNADEVIAKLGKSPTDIVVADWTLGGGDPRAFLQGLRATPQGSDKYVIPLGDQAAAGS